MGPLDVGRRLLPRADPAATGIRDRERKDWGMSTLTIPPRVVPYIRAGAQVQIADAAEQLATVIGEAMSRGIPPASEQQRLSQAWALVDLLGWPDEAGEPVELDVREHGEALCAALDGNAERLAELVADTDDGPQRASRASDLQELREFERTAREAIKRDRPMTICATMPAQVAVLLRGALYAELERACEDAPATTPASRTRRRMDTRAETHQQCVRRAERARMEGAHRAAAGADRAGRGADRSLGSRR